MNIYPDPAPPLYIGIDLGSSGAQGVVVDAHGAVHVTASSRYQSTTYPRAGHVEQDAEKGWWGVTVEICRTLLHGIDSQLVGAIAVSGLGPCVLMTDAQNRPLRRAILYAIDTRSVDQIAQLYEDSEVRKTCQRPEDLTTQAVGPKILWVRQNERQVWQYASRVFSSHSYISQRLSGAYVIDRKSLESWAPFWNGTEDKWESELVERYIPGIELPKVVDPDTVIGTVNESAALETGLSSGTPVVAGTIDFAADLVSSGANRAGDGVIVYGSTLSVNVVTLPKSGLPDGLTSHSGPQPGLWYVGGVTSAAGALLDWLSMVTGETLDELTEAAKSIPPGCEGVTLIPHFAGERSPEFKPKATGSILGLTLGHRRGHVFRAGLESVAYSAKNILDRVNAAVGTPKRLIAQGGAARNRTLMQIVSDVCGVTQEVSNARSGAAYGSAVLAARAIGYDPAKWEPCPNTAIVEPDALRAAAYEEALCRYRALDRAVKAHEEGR